MAPVPPNSARWKLAVKTESPEEQRWLRELSTYVEKLRYPPGSKSTRGLRVDSPKYKKLGDAVENLAKAIDGLDMAFTELDEG
jgi:hypothetical protein